MLDDLLKSIKSHEGFAQSPYIDPLVIKNPQKAGFTKSMMSFVKLALRKLKLTFGYGFTFLTQEEADAVLEIRVKSVIKELEKETKVFNALPLEVQAILTEMAYQMGVSGLMNFKKMWSALEVEDFEEAKIQMLDSRWAKQTPTRALSLSKRMSKTMSIL